MQTFDFTVNLAFSNQKGEPVQLDGEKLIEDLADPLYEAFQGRVSPAVSESVLTFHCHFEQELSGTALMRVITVLFGIGLPQSPSEVYISENDLPMSGLWKTAGSPRQGAFGQRREFA